MRPNKNSFRTKRTGFELTKADMTDVRAIVHALKMANLSFVEEGVADEIKMLIKDLPSAEEINTMATKPEGLKDVKQQIV